MNRKIAIVTGANSGLGLQTTRILLERDVEVIMACRNQKKAEDAKALLLKEYPNGKTTIIPIDLGNLSSVRKFVEEFKKRFLTLTYLVNNAGIMMVKYQKTEDGFEQQFGINHLGHFTLTGLLIDRLRTTNEARIVSLSSLYYRKGIIDFYDIMGQQNYSKSKAYAQSKLAILLFAQELSRKLDKKNIKNIKSIVIHPGGVKTNLLKHSKLLYLTSILGQSLKKGIACTEYALFNENAENGDFFGPSFMELKGYPKKAWLNEHARDQNVANKLWILSEKLTKTQFFNI